MSDSALHWLQLIESDLQRAIADLTVQYQGATLNDRARVFMVLSKVRERHTTVNNAIIDLLQNRIRINVPPVDTIDRTKLLTNELQRLIREGSRYDAMLKLLSDISVLVTQIIMEPMSA